MSFANETKAIFAEMFSDFCADVATGEGSIVFEKLSDSDNSIEDVVTVTEFEFDVRDAHGRHLPPDVEYELRINDANLTDANLLYNASLRHVVGERVIRYSIIRPSYFFPFRFNRLWRFWISPIAVIPAVVGVGTVLRFSETTYMQVNENEDPLQIAA